MKLLKLILANKITTLIIAVSLTGIILLSISTVKVIQVVNGIKTEQISTTTTESVTESSTETTTVVTTTETTTESTTESTTVTTTRPKSTTTTKASDPVITSKNVKEIFVPLIRHYTSLEQNWHFAIGLDYDKNYYTELVEVVCAQSDWTEMGIISIYKFKTAKTVADVKRTYKKYLSADIVNQAKLENDMQLFSYNNELYYIQGAKGTFDYNANSITYKGKKDGGYVVAIDRFLGNGVYLGTESFLVKYIDGRFKIVQKIGEEFLHPTEYYPSNYDSVIHQCMITE